MNKKGFTLIEVIISLAILSIVLSVAIYSLKYAANIIKHLKSPSTEQFINISLLQDALSSVFFFLEENEKTKVVEKRFNFFFYGEKRNITFITTKPIFHKRGRLYIVNLYLKDSTVYVKEYPVYSPKVDYKKPKLPDKTEKYILLRNIRDITIEYRLENQWKTSVKNKIPALIKFSLIDKDNKEMVYYFKPKSDFYMKKQIGIYLFQPF